MTEACTTLAVADNNQCCKTKALTALNSFGNAVDVDELFDQLFATFFGTATVVTTTTVAIAATTATIVTTTATTAPTTTIGRIRSRCCGFGGSSAALDFGFVSHLELQSAFACRVSQCFYATMEQETPTVEHDLGYASLLGTLGDSLAHQNRCVEVCTRLGARVLFDGRSCGNCLARCVVDDLRIDVTARPVNGQARTLAGAGTDSRTDTLAALFE